MGEITFALSIGIREALRDLMRRRRSDERAAVGQSSFYPSS
jgi:hypothetical protein